MNKPLGGYTFQRKKAAKAANIRPVLPAAVTRSAPFLLGVEVAESVGFKLPLLSVCVGVVPACVKRVFDGEIVEGDVVLDWVMANCPD